MYMKFHKLIDIIFLSLCPIISWGQADQVAEIRKELFFKEFDEVQTQLFYERMVNISQKTPVIKAYEGVAESRLLRSGDPLLLEQPSR